MTLEHLNQPQLMSFAGGSHARTLATRESKPGLTESEADCGANTSESFAQYDQKSSSWKTSQRCLFGDMAEFSETWPRAGTMRGGKCYRRVPLVPHISAAGFSTLRLGLIPTPTASDSETHCSDDQRFQSLSAYYRRMCGPGFLNPRFCEAVMGFPIGWSEIEDVEMQWFQPSENGSDDE